MRVVGNLLLTGFGLAVLGLAISFTASNDMVVTLGLWPVKTELSLPLWLVGLGGFGLGLIVGGLAMSLPLMTSRWRQNRLGRKLKTLEKQHAEQNGSDAVTKLPKA